MDAFEERWQDFEDCVQYIAGKNSGADYIITVNRKDYETASLPVRTPAEWLADTGGM